MYRPTVDPFAGKKLRGILFDLGSTLWQKSDDPVLKQRLEQEAMQRAIDVLLTRRQDLAREEAEHLCTQLRVELQRSVNSYFRHNDPNYEPDYIRLTGEAFQAVGFSEPDQQFTCEMHEALRVPIDQSRVLFDGVHSTLERLRERGFLLGVVTNRAYGGSPFLESMRVMGLLSYFDQRHLAISADLKVRKPHKNIFNYALHGLGLAPEETIMVGDNLHADIQGAKALGMYAIWRPKLTLLTKAREHFAQSEKVLDQEALVAYAAQKYDQEKQLVYDTLVQPDSTIEHIAELLDLVPQKSTVRC